MLACGCKLVIAGLELMRYFVGQCSLPLFFFVLYFHFFLLFSSFFPTFSSFSSFSPIFFFFVFFLFLYSFFFPFLKVLSATRGQLTLSICCTVNRNKSRKSRPRKGGHLTIFFYFAHLCTRKNTPYSANGTA